MDTRAYRLNWPQRSVIYDVSPERVFAIASQQLQGIGAKIPRSCLLVHIPFESPDIGEILCMKGFNGNRSSVWAMQGLPVETLAGLENLLLTIRSLAAKGSILFGELPPFSDWSSTINMVDKQGALENIFLRHGFRFSTLDYKDVAEDFSLDFVPQSEDHGGVLFVAEQLRLSEAQMDNWWMHFERIEEDGDEEGFEEL